MSSQGAKSSAYVFTHVKYLLLVLIICAFFEKFANATDIGQLFLKQAMCPGKVIQLDRCPVSTRSDEATGCSMGCAGDSQCVGFLWDDASGVCHLCDQLVSEDCLTNTQTTGGFEAFEKLQKCNANSRLTALNRCECIEGMTGNLCQKRMRDCEDWAGEGFTSVGVYWLRPSPNHDAFRIFCGSALTRSYVMKHNDTAFSFYRGWDEYANGFGDLTGTEPENFWLGLNKMSLLTKSGIPGLCLVFEFLTPGSHYKTQYKPITVSDASQDFSVDYATTTYYNSPANDLGDCLGVVKGQPFSTYDADHDGDGTRNCAQRHQSGWWMGTGQAGECTKCNPTGKLLKPADGKRTNVPEEVFWTPLADGSIGPRFVGIWIERC